MQNSNDMIRRSGVVGVLANLLRRRWLSAFSAVAILLVSPGAYAWSQCSVGAFPVLNFGTVVVPRDAAVGSAVGPVVSATINVSCPANVSSPNSGFYLQYTSTLQASSVSGVWATGMSGIGIRVTDVTYGNSVISGTAKGDFGPWTATSAYNQAITFNFQLVKTAAQVTQSGLVNIAPIMSLISHDVPNNQTSAVLSSASAGGSITVTSCLVTTPNVNVALPPVVSSALSAATTAGDTPFSIGLNCSAGSMVNVTLTDATTPGNRTSILSLTNKSTASGVAVRMLRSDRSAISYGADSAVAGNPNQWLVGASASVSNISLIAQYIATGTVKAGSVNALATVTMSYQ